MIKIEVPKFNSEEEEANWWHAHADEHDLLMAEAIKRGETTTLPEVLRRNREKLRGAASEPVQLDPGDVSRAQSIAAKKGVPFQTYVKNLVHEALDREERKAS
jgi:hypothetical protein